MRTSKSGRVVGVTCVLLAASLNGLLPLMVTTVYESGGHFTNIMFYKGMIVVPVAYLICRWRSIPVGITLNQHKACAAIALLQFITSMLLYGSYNLISTGLATTLHFMYPVAVILLAALLFREKPSKRELISLVCCIAGVILLCSTTHDVNQNLLGILAALLSGIVYAGYILTVGKSSVNILPSMVFALYVFFYNMIFSGLVSICTGTLNGLTGSGWIVTAVSALAAGIVTIALQRGIMEVGSQTASILSVAEPLVSVLVGVVFLQELFSLRSALGTLYVVAAAIIATHIKKN